MSEADLTAPVADVGGPQQPLLEVRAASPQALLRLAWHIGNRHTDMQVMGDRLRIRRDHVLEDMLRGLGRHREARVGGHGREPQDAQACAHENLFQGSSEAGRSRKWSSDPREKPVSLLT